MKILLLANHARRGGITTYLSVLARELVRRGHRVLVVTGGGEAVEAFRQSGAEHRALFLDTSSEVNPGLLASVRTLRKWVLSEGWQVVHCQTRVAQWVAALALARTDVPRLTTCHGFFRVRFFRKVMPLWGCRVIAISRAVERHLNDDWGLSADRVFYVPHGVERLSNDEQAAAARLRSRAELQLHPATVLLGTLGRLSPVKGYHVLLEAMAHLRDLPVQWVMIGDGPEAERLERRITELDLASRVRRLPSVPNHHDILHAFDIFCAPSLQEGLGLSALDAMARGTVVVASRTGGLTDLIHHGETGRLVAPSDPAALAAAIRDLAQDASARSRMASAARRFVEREFPLGRMIRGTEQVYEEAIHRGSMPKPNERSI